MSDTPAESSASARSLSKRNHRSILERLSYLMSGGPEDREQLLHILRQSHERQLLDADALSMIEGVLQVAELAARDVMLPRAQMDMVDVSWTKTEVTDFVSKSGHSRFPVFEDSRDNVLGILHAKDLLPNLNKEDFDLRHALRPAVFIPEAKRLNVLLRDFRANRNHIAIVVDEYGGVAGMITIEDVLEQIVGDIEDEFDFDEEADHIVATEPGSYGPRYRVKAITEISQFNESFGVALPDGDFDTVGGLITDTFGRVPRRGESVTLANLRFEVLRTDARQVDVLLVDRLPEDAAQEPTQP
jgi:magnesium and cobalt transporter